MKKTTLIVIAFLCLLKPAFSFAATYYISPAGNDTLGIGSSALPWTSLSKAFSQMAGGDTLIVKDGTYTGTNNQITNVQYPPFGSAGNYTVIKAEHDGEAIFDGENARSMFGYTPNDLVVKSNYWQFEGLLWCNSNGSDVSVCYSSYVKFLRCGAYDCGDGNTINFVANRYCSYILFENCYAYGSGRYKFMAYQSNNIIFRQCVGRLDRHNGWSGSHGEPFGIFSMYSVDDGEVQNCIGIDSDQSLAWSNYSQLAGAFLVPSTDMDANRINFVNCIGLNNRLGGICTTGNEYQLSKDINFSNCVIWNSDTVDGSTINTIRGLRTNISNCTFGYARNINYHYILSWDGIGYNNDTIIKNSVFWSIQGNASYATLNDVETEDYNCLYDNTNNYSATTQGTHTKLTTNPIYNVTTNPTGALKYITRIEAGSNLSGYADDAGDIGANITTLIGTSGTLWGEAGYATDTGVSMWPFPNEDLIRSKMKEYNAGGVSGNRGFCTEGTTLTRYIWQYLGNTIPSSIYAGTILTTTPSPPPTPIPIPTPLPAPIVTPAPTARPTQTIQDYISPAAITDLRVIGYSRNGITLYWITPGDDGMVGTATSYDIRYSKALITEANFLSATKIEKSPIPARAGTRKSFIVTNLEPGTKYYFAIKTKDEAGNISAMSNIVIGQTKAKSYR